MENGLMATGVQSNVKEKKNDVNIKGEKNEWEETVAILAIGFPRTYTWENCIRTTHTPYCMGGHIKVNTQEAEEG